MQKRLEHFREAPPKPSSERMYQMRLRHLTEALACLATAGDLIERVMKAELVEEEKRDKIRRAFNHTVSVVTMQSSRVFEELSGQQPVDKRCKNTPEQVREILRVCDAEPNLSIRQLGNRFNIPPSTVSDIINRRTWKNLS